MASTCVTDNLLQQAHLDTIFDLEYMAKRREYASLNAVLENQNPAFPVAQQAKECTKFKFNWDLSCGGSTADATADCDITPSLTDEVSCADYEITNAKEYVFSVSEAEFECLGGEAMFNGKVARKMVEAMSVLTADEVIPNILAKVDALSAGANLYTSEYDVQATQTNVRASAWSSDLLGYFKKVKRWNKYNKGILLSGYSPFERMIEKDFAGNGVQGVYFDDYNISDALATQDTYLFDANRIKLISTHFNTNTASNKPNLGIGEWATWSIENKFVPGTRLDVHHTKACGNDKYNVHTFKIKARYDTISAPADVCDSSAHALKFVCA